MKQKKQKEMMKNARSNFDQLNQQGIFSPPLGQTYFTPKSNSSFVLSYNNSEKK